MAKWLVQKFQELPKFKSLSIQSYLELNGKTKSIELDTENCLVSFDANSLFSSISKDKLLTVLEEWLNSSAMTKKKSKDM